MFHGSEYFLRKEMKLENHGECKMFFSCQHFLMFWRFGKYFDAIKLGECRFSLNHILPYKDRIYYLQNLYTLRVAVNHIVHNECNITVRRVYNCFWPLRGSVNLCEKKFILSSSNRTKKIHPWDKLLNLKKYIFNQHLNIQIQRQYLLN